MSNKHLLSKQYLKQVSILFNPFDDLFLQAVSSVRFNKQHNKKGFVLFCDSFQGVVEVKNLVVAPKKTKLTNIKEFFLEDFI